MFGARVVIKKGNRDDAEKPFWISFADLMTAMMVLFLVVMCVALLAVTKTDSEHEKDLERMLERFAVVAKGYDGIKVDKLRSVIDFGDRASFAFGTSKLDPEQERVLRQFVPEILKLANDDLGQRVLKRIVVEGYTDKAGSYLSNLNLSLQRSQRVLCAMFSDIGANQLTAAQKEDVRNLFLVGGYSFNAPKDTPEESRRVEMRLEFFGVNDKRAPAPNQSGNFGDCALP